MNINYLLKYSRKLLAKFSPHVLTKLVVMMMILTVVEVSAKPTYAQNVSLNIKKASITQILQLLIKQTGYEFLYEPDELSAYQSETLNMTNKPLREVLDVVFSNKSLKCSIQDNIVIIERLKPEQTKAMPVTGQVVDESGLPVPGVSIKLKGGALVGQTNNNGEFTVQVPDEQAILQFTAVGFETLEKVVTAGKIRIVIKAAINTMEDVIVVGYGTTTRKKIAGAVDQVRASQLANRPTANLTQALQGAAPSLSIQQRSMDPNGNTTNLNIRGVSTMNSNTPLIVIDGLISDGSSLNKLNPADIETVSILKDAGASAIYGSRSANGVLLITTKKGMKNQGPVIRLDGQIGLQDPKILFTPVTGYQNATLKNLSLTNVGMAPQFSPTQIQDLYAHEGEEDWYFNQILKTATQQNYNVNVSGGGANTTYLFSGGFYDQGSNYEGNYGIKRYNLRSNITAEYKRFKFSSILTYTRNNSNASTASNAIVNSSRIPTYYYYKMVAPNGKYLVNDVLTDQNPLAELRDGGYINSDNNYFNANLNVEARLFDGLKFRGVFGADVINDHRFTRRKQIPLYSSETATAPLVFMNSTRNTEDYNQQVSLLNYQLLLDYSKTLGKHSITGLFGASNESYTRRANEIKYKFTDPILGTPTTGTEIDPTSYGSLGATTENSINSLFGRAGYAYADRYTAEFNFRYDGSSKFEKAIRWGFFPSGSVGWSLSDEVFLARYKEKVGDLKLRASYGLLGNQDIDSYQFLTSYTPYTNSYGFNNVGVTGAGFTFGTPNLLWEVTHTLNIGVDANFFNKALTVSFDYFSKTTKDILISPTIPSVFGTTLGKYNAGQMRNQGWELTVEYQVKTGSFNHNFSGNIGDSRNKVLKFVGDEQITTADNISKITRVGLPFNSYYGYKISGLFQSMEELETAALPVGMSASDLKPGDVRYTDRNGDGVIDSKDRFVLGNAFPRFTFGFNYNLNYKGFDFGMLWQGVGKRDMVVRGELIEPFHENYSYVIYQHQLNYWTPTNTDATQPRLTPAGATPTKNNYQMGSDLYLFEGSYIRLKNIQLGYTIPKNISQKIGMQKLRVFANAQNLLTFSANSWIDPESSEFDSNMSGSANSARNYPTLKYYGLGFNIEL
ncbi:TonB-dependent receptor [Pedobacter frigidisoli]|uniref:TonB-dependent receptor n=1 Tax=Pedobacter frigidisoli TaxID=2530455 RepID=UPI00292F7F55|nr:TonB-dependent receptor [Pedobacter frigidisoli]